MMIKNFEIFIRWELYDQITVQAETIEEALSKALKYGVTESAVQDLIEVSHFEDELGVERTFKKN